MSKRAAFSKIREAREEMVKQAVEIVRLQKKNAIDAMVKGDHDVANDAFQWILEHTPSEDGVTVLDPSVDKQQIQESNGPKISIGIALGGVTPKALPPPKKELPPAPDVLDGELEIDLLKELSERSEEERSE